MRADSLALVSAIAIGMSCNAFAGPQLGVYEGAAAPSKVDTFSQWLGAPAIVASDFLNNDSWDNVSGPAWQLGPWSQWVRAQPGRNVALSIPMFLKSGGSLDACAAGQYDVYWTRLANNLAYYGLHWAYLRLGKEMDGTWEAWSAPPGSGREASFAGCFRRMVQVMRQAQPANQWKFVLNFAGSWKNTTYLQAIWPGDAYVDVVGTDLYDQSWASNTYPYPSTCDAACRLTHQQTAWTYTYKLLAGIRDFAAAHGKPMALPEWGLMTRSDGHGGGDDPYYIQKMYEFVIDPANNVAYHSYFDISYQGMDSKISPTTNFPNGSARYKQLFAANTGPSVSITSPAAGQTVSGAVAYAASATDNGGVSRVVFYVDSTALFSDSTAPYGGSFDSTKLANGTHVLKAIAYDAQGLSAASQVSINVKNGTSGPTVAFKAPLANATISGSFSNSSACEVTGTGISKVVFFMDSTQLNTESYSPWNCSIDTRKFANGAHVLKAVAYNSAGASTTVSESVTVQNGPSVAFKAPLANATISGSFSNSSACEVTGTGIRKVVFLMDSTQLNTESYSPWNCKIDTRKFANGAHVLKAVAYDAAGLSTTVAETVYVKN